VGDDVPLVDPAVPNGGDAVLGHAATAQDGEVTVGGDLMGARCDVSPPRMARGGWIGEPCSSMAASVQVLRYSRQETVQILCVTVIATQIQPRAVNGQRQNLADMLMCQHCRRLWLVTRFGMMVRHTVANRARLPDGSHAGRRVFSDVRGDVEDTAFVRLEARCPNHRVVGFGW
jgi:hypothetical protein